ncbi:uncharacterized protein PV06_02312 [Exophiala oligosperma]|uniref:Uncharacterized protein n=1 Tax=Exophiala oligosperma TaxID=215243 RepID=A0A0D2DU15_9EURO|nr:uncharacterized protein PV06_02312 [Exophiala oligosperma]KIW46658.1 hypothetical protein PV06_02312 [Exophiala oligosperma]
MRNQGTSTSTASDKRETNHAGSLTDTQTHTHKRRDPWRPCTRKNVRNISYTGNGCLPACLVAPRWEKGQKGKPRKMNKNNPRTSVPSHLFHIQPLLSHLTKGRWTTHFDPTETIPDRRQTSLQQQHQERETVEFGRMKNNIELSCNAVVDAFRSSNTSATTTIPSTLRPSGHSLFQHLTRFSSIQSDSRPSATITAFEKKISRGKNPIYQRSRCGSPRPNDVPYGEKSLEDDRRCLP